VEERWQNNQFLAATHHRRARRRAQAVVDGGVQFPRQSANCKINDRFGGAVSAQAHVGEGAGGPAQAGRVAGRESASGGAPQLVVVSRAVKSPVPPGSMGAVGRCALLNILKCSRVP
jgi:hypothetical protein